MPLLVASSACLADTLSAKIDVSQTFQTMDGWGASMINYDNANAAVVYDDPRYRAAFRDLGLNILRVPMSKDVLTSTPTADDPMGLKGQVLLSPTDMSGNIAKMNFSVPQAASFGSMAQWLTQNALEPSKVQITGASFSPPNWMKAPTGTYIGGQNANYINSTGDSVGGYLNVHLNDDTDRTDPNSARQQFGIYLASWVKGFEQSYGVKMSAINIQNEPNIEANYDSMLLTGTYAGDDDPYIYGKALSAVSDAWKSFGLTTKVMGAGVSGFGDNETTMGPQNMHGLTQQREMMNTAASYGVQNFLSIDSANFYNTLDANAMKVVAAYYHGAVMTGDKTGSVPSDAVEANWSDDYMYGTGIAPANGDIAAHTYAPGVASDGRPIWYTEAAGESPTWLDNSSGVTGGAITVSLKIFDALVYSNASSYQYWQLADTSATTDGFTLIGTNDLNDPTASKKYDAFKQFSRYIRPGAVRVAATFNATGTASYGSPISGTDAQYDSENSLNMAAFVMPDKSSFTLVLVNMLAGDQTVTVAVPYGDTITTYEVFTTDANDNFLQLDNVNVIDGQITFTVGGDAVMTLYGVTPEPTSLSLLAFGGFVVLKRRTRKKLRVVA